MGCIMDARRRLACTAPRQMKTLKALESIVHMVEDVESMAAALQALRDGTTEEEWEAIIANPLVDELITACVDVEAHVY